MAHAEVAQLGGDLDDGQDLRAAEGIEPGLSDEQWDAISDKLVSWVTGHVFDVRPAPVDGSTHSVALPDASIDLGGLSTLVGLPPLSGLGLKVGFGNAHGSFTVDVKQRAEGHRRAVWEQRFVVSEPFTVAGAVSLGEYSTC